MFGKIADKLNKKIQKSEEEITFKKYDDEADDIATVKSEPSGSTLTADESEKDSSIIFKVVKPQSFEDVSTIADYLIDGCTVVLNTELLETTVRYRMLDFLNGVTYTTDGDIKLLGKKRLLVRDSNDNRYQVGDIANLSKASIKKIYSYL